jgi:hypothetical protein
MKWVLSVILVIGMLCLLEYVFEPLNDAVNQFLYETLRQ